MNLVTKIVKMVLHRSVRRKDDDMHRNMIISADWSTCLRSHLLLAPVVLVVLSTVSMQTALAQNPVHMNWAEHHDYQEFTQLVHRWAAAYPNLVTVESIGESVQGRELWMLTITNTATAKASEKPALWIDGNTDGGQLLSKVVALYFIHYLLTNYDTNERVRHLLDTRTLYILPDGNPDSGEQIIQPPQKGKIQGVFTDGYLYPWDEDGDGQADEDPPEDINGDGLVVAMRVQDPEGEWKVAEDHPLMIRRKPDDGPEDGPYYRLYPTEGIDNDGDGRINEDWLGGFDSNRVFPGNWEPSFRQLGASPYPLFVPEARALVDAVLARPNIAALISLHTSGLFPGGTLWQPPASASPSEFPSFDMEYLYPVFGAEYERIMRHQEKYPHSCATAANVYRRLPDTPIYGTLIDWAYINRGIIAWTPEFWSAGGFDYNGDCKISLDEKWRWSQQEWDGKPFLMWRKVEHPEFGTVEVGGWRNDFGGGILPVEGWLGRAKQSVPWLLYVFESLPKVVLSNVNSERIESSLYRVSATVSNVGFLPTSSTKYAASLVVKRGVQTGVQSFVPIAEPVKASLQSAAGKVLTDTVVNVEYLRGQNTEQEQHPANLDWSNSVDVSWKVRAPEGTSVTVRVGTTRAGFATESLQLQ